VTRAAALLAGIAVALSASVAAAAPIHELELSAGYDDNVGNAGHEDDRRGSASIHAATSLGWERRYGRYTALQLRGSLAVEELFEIVELSSLRASGRATVLHKPGRGFYTPVLAAWGSVGGREYGSAIRDSADYRAGLSATAPLTTAIQARVEAGASRRAARRRVFDLDSTSYGLSFDWRAASRLIVYGGARVEQGDFVVTARGYGAISPKTEHLYLEPRASAIEADPAFGAGWWAFRVNGRTTVGTLGVNVPMSPTVSVDVQLQRGLAHMGRFDYVRDSGYAGLLLRW
jgi:hypothetical protein